MSTSTLYFTFYKKNHFAAKLTKCVFATNEIPFLGHFISAKGVTPNPEKINLIQTWPKPKSLTYLRAFLGLKGFYRRFVRHYAHLTAPLIDLLKLKSFSWPSTADIAFSDFKQAMANLLALALPDFNFPFDLTTDASSTNIGAVLSQNNKPIAFFVKKSCPRTQVASTYVWELYAIIEAVKKWHQYLLGRKFRVYTDHHSLKNLLTQTIQMPEQHKWVVKLMGYDFDIHYKPGKENTVADALSCSAAPTFFAIMRPQALWLDKIRAYFVNNPDG